MAFVHDDDRGRRHLNLLTDDAADVQRLDAGDLDVEQAASRLRTLDAAVAGAPEED